MTLSALMAGALVASAVITAPPAHAQNPNAIDWTVRVSFPDLLGVQIPLRVGQNDLPDGTPGFGERHIIDAHGTVPPPELIGEAVGGDCLTQPPEPSRILCETDEVTVIYSIASDARSGDDLPFGIITAFFNAPPPV